MITAYCRLILGPLLPGFSEGKDAQYEGRAAGAISSCCLKASFAIYASDRALCHGESLFVHDRELMRWVKRGSAIVGNLGARPETHRRRLQSQLFCDGLTKMSARPLPSHATLLANNTLVPGIFTTPPRLYDSRHAQILFLCQQRHARGSATSATNSARNASPAVTRQITPEYLQYGLRVLWKLFRRFRSCE